MRAQILRPIRQKHLHIEPNLSLNGTHSMGLQQQMLKYLVSWKGTGGSEANLLFIGFDKGEYQLPITSKGVLKNLFQAKVIAFWNRKKFNSFRPGGFQTQGHFPFGWIEIADESHSVLAMPRLLV